MRGDKELSTEPLKARIRVKVTWDGQSWKVNLPEYIMVPGSWQPRVPDMIHADGVDPRDTTQKALTFNPTCEVLVPVRITDLETGRPSKEKIRQLYRGQPLWDRPDVGEDV